GDAKLEVAAVHRPDVGPQPVHDRKQRAAAVGGHFAFQCFGRARMGIHSADWPGLTGRKRRPSNPSHIEIFWTAITPNGKMEPQTAMPPTRLDAPPPLGPHPLPMSTIKSICVYCASGPGNDPAFMGAAKELGRILAENGIRLVYGGGSVGLMGALAESVLDHGGGVARGVPGFFFYTGDKLLRPLERGLTHPTPQSP